MKFTRRSFLQTGTAAAVTAAVKPSITAIASRKRNVLFIGVDDQNAWLGCYTNGLVHTPNLDALAARGTRFAANYCQYPLCGPSRTSLLTGLAPDTTKMTDNRKPYFRENIPNVVTLPQLFRQNGYFVGRVGKIYHQDNPSGIGKSGPDDAQSWDYVFNPAGVDRTREEPLLTTFWHPEGHPEYYGVDICFYESNAADNEITDSLGADEVIRLMRQSKDRPFFFAYGLYRPHVPWIVPKKYFDLYPLETIQACPFNEAELKNAPACAYTTAPPNYGMSELQQRIAIRAYRASSSFMDAQVGRVLAELKRLGLEKDTLVVFWTDHGWSLGEHGQWQKQNLFESATRVPLIFAGPGVGRGQVCHRTTEHLDIYPTVTELCQLSEAPSSLQGVSLSGLMKDPRMAWDRPAISQVFRGQKNHGYSIRTERYRYTLWIGDETGEELYDYEKDPRELVNLANDSSLVKLKQSLRERLDAIAASRGSNLDLQRAI